MQHRAAFACFLCVLVALAVRPQKQTDTIDDDGEIGAQDLTNNTDSSTNKKAPGGGICSVVEKGDVHQYGVHFAVPITGRCGVATCTSGAAAWEVSTQSTQARNSIYEKVISVRLGGGGHKCRCMLGDYKFYWFRVSRAETDCTSDKCWYEFSTKLRQKAGLTVGVSTNDLLTSPQHFDYECVDAAPLPANQVPGMPPPNTGGATIAPDSAAVAQRIAAFEAQVKETLESQGKGELFDASVWQVILNWQEEVDLDIHMTWGSKHLQSGLLVEGADHIRPFMLDIDDQGTADGGHVEHINLDSKDATLPDETYNIYVDCFADNRGDRSVPLPFTVTINLGGAGKKLMESHVCAGTRAQDVITFTVEDGAISIGDR